MRVRGWIVASVAGICLVVPAGASAAVFGGSTTDAVTNDCNECAVLNVTDPSGAAIGGSPITGILTSVRIRTLGTGATGLFRVLRPTGVTSEYLDAAEIPVTVPTITMPGGAVTQVLTRVPINAGDRIAAVFQTDVEEFALTGSASCAYKTEPPVETVGQTGSYPAVACPYELLIQGTVEPDADHDGYGDLTQDQCPTDASTQGPCPVAPPPTPTPKCKKKKAKHAAAAKKKKCKHRGKKH